jgi:hypothetical protein
MRFVSIFLAVVFAKVGIWSLISIPHNRAKVQASANEFAAQRKELLDGYRQKTGKEPKENLAWAPRVIEKVPGWVASFNIAVAACCFVGSGLLVWISFRRRQVAVPAHQSK